jgi:hypothetical protein
MTTFQAFTVYFEILAALFMLAYFFLTDEEKEVISKEIDRRFLEAWKQIKERLKVLYSIHIKRR